MLIPSIKAHAYEDDASLSRRVNANSQLTYGRAHGYVKLIKKGEC